MIKLNTFQNDGKQVDGRSTDAESPIQITEVPSASRSNQKDARLYFKVMGQA